MIINRYAKGGGLSPRIVVTAATGSTVTCTKGSTTLTAAEVDGKWTFNLNDFGTWTVTAMLGDKSATKDVDVVWAQLYEVTLLFVDATLDNNDWETIKQVADASAGESYWAVGDTKQIAINGKLSDGLTLSNYSTYVYIIGFDHNKDVEGTGIAFQGFKTAQTGGTDICLCDSGYNNSYSSGQWFNMNNNDSTSGGWNSCNMRNNTLPVVKATLPSDLQAAIKTTTLYTDNTGGSSTSASYVTATQDELYLLAEFEIFGARIFANTVEQNYQKQYAYYDAGNSKVKYKHDSTATAVTWWERSVYVADTNRFCGVNTGGTAGPADAYYSRGLAPAFKVGTTPIFPTLNDNSWSAIAKVAYTSEGANYWSVGDTKEITINGKVSDGLTLSNYKTWVYILGFDHNEAIEGKGIVFGGFKTAQASGVDVALCDSGYNSAKPSGQWFNMNNSFSNTGGWSSCVMRSGALQSIKNSLSSELGSVIKTSTIYSDNTGGDSDVASHVTSTTDDLYLLAEFEIFGVRSYANSTEQNYQQQYTYYSAGNSKIKYRHDSTTNEAFWWERSVDVTDAARFCGVSTAGTAVQNGANYSFGLAPAFRVCYTPPQPISGLAVGDIVKVKESGTDVDYIIIQQGNPDASVYDASCDGTWLLRKDVVGQSQWNSTGVNSYSGSTIDTYLNSTFINTTNIGDIIKEVKIPYRTKGKNGQNYSLENGLSTKVFLLSGSEVNTTLTTYMSIEGVHLGYFSDNTSRLAYDGGNVRFWWLRSPYTLDEGYVWGVDTIGGFARYVAQESKWVRPAFIISSDTLVSADGTIQV